MSFDSCTVSFDTKDNVLTAAVSGEIDHHSAKTMREKIDAELFYLRPDKLIVDMSRVTFMDSSGLGLIMGRMKSAEEIGCGFALKNPGERIKRLLDLAGADRIFDITEEKASKGEKK